MDEKQYRIIAREEAERLLRDSIQHEPVTIESVGVLKGGKVYWCKVVKV